MSVLPSTMPRCVYTGVLTVTLASLAAMPLLGSDPAWWPGFVAASLTASLGGVVLWRRDALTTGQVLAGAVLLRLAFLPMLPVLSDDVFRYVWDGWIQVNGVNPYHFVPSDPALATFQEASLYGRLNSQDYFSVYPPLSQAIFAVGGFAYEAWGWKGGYYAIKLCLSGLETGGLVLLARMTSARTLLLYAWNPLVLIAAAGQGHTEAAVVPWIVAAVWAVRADRGRLASLAVAAATLVKLYPVVLGPLLVRRFGWRAVWPGALLVGGLCAPYAAPYVLSHVKTSVDLYTQLFEFNAGPYYAVKQTLGWATGSDWSKQIGPAFRVGFVGLLPALYIVDAWRKWRFRKAALWTVGLFFALSTTVHPWYLLGIVPLAVLSEDAERPAWSWLWLAGASMGTYLLYVDGPYWPWVWIGWSGWAALGAWSQRRTLVRLADSVLQRIQRRRAAAKVERIASHLHTLASRTGSGDGASTDSVRGTFRVLDLGAGEGYVGDAIAVQTGADVHLVDVVDMNRTKRPLTTYDGRTLPFADDAFDATVLYFVLHHCEDPERVLSEALRVSRCGVVVVESVYHSDVQRRVLRVLDTAANRLRSAGRMNDQEVHLAFRRTTAWQQLAESLGAQVDAATVRGRWIHPQATLRLTPAPHAVATP